MKRFSNFITILFILSLCFLAIHASYDGIVLGEAEDWGVTLAEYFFYLALVYLTIPVLGLILARRYNPIGWGILGLYALQVMYGAGITDDRPMLGIMPRLLGFLGIQITSLRGFGFFSIILEILGLAPSEPHAATAFSSFVAYTNIALNGALLFLCLWVLYAWLRGQMTQPMMS